MRKLKKIIIIAIIAILLVSLTGCNNTSNNTTANQGKNNVSISNTSNKVNSTSSSSAAGSSNSSNTTNSTKIDVTKYDFLSAAKVQVANANKGDIIAIFHIKDYGDIKVKFFKDVAPKAVENFVTHAKDGYYNGTTFHRVINNFMIQGGDPTATGRGGESIWKKNFEDEFDYSLVPYRGALCMANTGAKSSNGSQFFIEQAGYDESTYQLLKNNGYPDNLLEAYKQYGGSMHLFFKHTVFGQVIEGMDIVDKIAKCETNSSNKPVKDVVIESIEITEL